MHSAAILRKVNVMARIVLHSPLGGLTPASCHLKWAGEGIQSDTCMWDGQNKMGRENRKKYVLFYILPISIH